jgi:membrane-associated phospholipid phosphatase
MLAALAWDGRCLVSVQWVQMAIVWAVAVSLSRVMLGRHHVLDVVAGSLVGVFQFWFLK